jgi:hypothetical protein
MQEVANNFDRELEKPWSWFKLINLHVQRIYFRETTTGAFPIELMMFHI